MEGYVEQNQRIREQIHATFSCKLNFVGNSIPLDFQRQQLRLKCLVETECDCELMIKLMSRNEIIKSRRNGIWPLHLDDLWFRD